MRDLYTFQIQWRKAHVIKAGKFIVIFNRNTILGSEDSLGEAQYLCESHSHACPRGRYEIFLLAEASVSGVMGEQIAWQKGSESTDGTRENPS